MLSVLLTQQFVGVLKRLAARPRGFVMVAASAGVPAIALVGFVASQGLRPGLLQVLEWLPTSIGMHALKAWELGDTGTGAAYLGLSIALVASLAASTTWLLFKDLSIDPPLHLARRGKENLWSFEHPRAGVARLFVAQVFGAKYGKILAILPFFVTGGFVLAAVKIEHVAKGSVFEKLFVEAQTYPLYALVPPLIVALAGGVWMNQFAWHGRGIKALLLAPLRSRDILDGNLIALLRMLVPLSLLACLPLVYLDFAPPQAVVLAKQATANLATGVAAELATGVAASVLVVCVLGTLGHLFSVRFPRQLSESGTGVASAPFTLQLASTAAVGVLGLVGIGIYAGLAGLHALAPVAAFVLLTAVVLVLRRFSMPRLERAFDAGRENLSETLA